MFTAQAKNLSRVKLIRGEHRHCEECAQRHDEAIHYNRAAQSLHEAFYGLLRTLRSLAMTVFAGLPRFTCSQVYFLSHKGLCLLMLSTLLPLNAPASNPLELLEPKLKEFSIVTSTQIGLNLAGQDVHVFNVKIKPYADLVNQCNELAMLNRQHDPQHVLDFLSAMRLEHGFPAEFETEITNIRAYLKAGLDFDKETNMRVSHMLSALRNFFDVAHFQNPKAILSEIFFYLKQNTVEQGGCFPGYAGRLMLINGLFILEIREILHIWPEYLEDIKNCLDCSESL